MQQTAIGAAESFPWLKSYPPGIDWGAEIAVKPMHALMDDAAARFGDQPCIDFLGRRYSYGEIGRLVRRAAQGFKALGVGPGIKVGLCLPNTPYFVISYFAVLRAGGTLVNFNPLYSERELIHQIEDSECDVMVTLDVASIYDKLAGILGCARLKKLVVCSMAQALPFPRNWLYPWVMRHEVARIPAGAAHVSFDRLIDNDGAMAAEAIDPRKAIALLQYMNWAVHEGAEMILLPRFQITNLLKTIMARKPSVMPGVPTLFNAILNAPDLAKYNLRSLKFCVSGGASLPRELGVAFQRVTGARLLEGYGLSETSPVACCNPVNGEARPGSVGLPYPATVIRIVSLDPPRRVLESGETGEICISGPQVMAGYWKRPDETAKAMIGGLFATGDIGHMDQDGYVFVTDRLKDMINASGFKVYPRNIEEAILLHPSVLECAVVGLPDPYRGQTVKAFVALKAGAALSAQELTAFLADKLTPIEMPKQIEFRSALPKTAVGKISKKLLLEEGSAP